VDIVIFIPARAGSKRIPRKNFQEIGGIPLFLHSVHAAVSLIDFSLDPAIFVDTDDLKTCNAIKSRLFFSGQQTMADRMMLIKRPAELARDETTADELAYWQATQYPNAKIYIQLMPTCPFIKPATIRRAIAKVESGGWDSATGTVSAAAVRREVVYEWDEHGPAYFAPDGSIPPSQEKAPLVHEMGLYVSRMPYVLGAKKRANPDSCAPVYLSRIEAIDINWPEDLQFARIVWAGIQAMDERKGE